GANGATGATGATGQPGPGSIKSFTITTSSWVNSDPAWIATLNVSAITQNVLSNGAVLVYIKDGTDYFQLPLTIPEDTYFTTYQFRHDLGVVDVFVLDSDGLLPINPGTTTFKVVVISGTGKNPNVNYNDYNAVKAYYGLVD
ncbi:MAG: hypothetical protein RL582_36, partial [Bacteroidota bacterium]